MPAHELIAVAGHGRPDDLLALLADDGIHLVAAVGDKGDLHLIEGRFVGIL